MGLLDEYPMGYYDATAAQAVPPETGFTTGLLGMPAATTGLLADNPAGFAPMAPFGASLAGAGPMAAPRGPFGAGLLGGGGEPTDWRSLLMSAGAGLLKSGGRIEGLGDGIMSGMRLGQQNAGQRQLHALRGLQIQQMQRQMAENERLDAAWSRMFEPVQAKAPAPAGREFGSVPAVAMPQLPDNGPPTTMPALTGGAPTASIEMGAGQPPQQAEQPRYHPLIAGLLPEERETLRGMGRQRGEPWLLSRLNKDVAAPKLEDSYDDQGRAIKVIWDRASNSFVQASGAKPTDHQAQTVTTNDGIFVLNRDGSLGRRLGDRPDDIVTVGNQAFRKSELTGGSAPAEARPAAPFNWSQAMGTRMDEATPALIAATRGQESGGRPGLVSPKGAFGVMQTMPGTWADMAREVGIEDTPANRADERINEQLGARYMNKMLQRYGGIVPMALAAYNAGPGTVDGWARTFGDPRLGEITPAAWALRIPVKETRDYVPSVLRRMGEAQAAEPRAEASAAPRAPRPVVEVPRNEPVVSIVDPASPTGFRYVPQSAAAGQPAVGPIGTRLVSDGKGGLTFVSGPGAGAANDLDKPTTTEVQKKAVNTVEVMGRLQSIGGSFKDEYLQLPARLGAWGNAIREKAGFRLDAGNRRSLEEFTTFKAAALGNLNATLKEMSGAAVSDQEYKRITGQLPNAGTGLFDGDSPSEFRSKLKLSVRDARRAMIRYNHLLARGIPFNAEKDDFGGIKLDDVDGLINKRAREIESELRKANPRLDPSILDAETDARLRKEFGI